MGFCEIVDCLSQFWSYPSSGRYRRLSVTNFSIVEKGVVWSVSGAESHDSETRYQTIIGQVKGRKIIYGASVHSVVEQSDPENDHHQAEMSVVEISDEGGDVVTAVDYNGVIFPNFDPDIIRNISSIDIRDGDIILCAYPKSGSHWMREVTRLVLAGRLDADDRDKMLTMLEMSPESGYIDLPSPRLLNTHVGVQHLPPSVFNKKVKVVYILRNPKDVAVSYYNFNRSARVPYKGEWANYLRPFAQGKFQYGSWFDSVREWEEVKRTHPALQIHTLFYEDVKENPVREAKRLSVFLGVERSEEYLEHVCRTCSFDNMKANAASARAAKAYRKGEVGDWKNWFTVAQNEWFDQLYQEKMADCKLQFRYSLDASE